MDTINNNTIKEFYDWVFVDLGDPRTNSWPLLGDPLPILSILLFYLYFSLKLGPKYMEHRKPYDLKNVLLVYNFLQVLISMYLFRRSWWMWTELYNWRCAPVDYSNSEVALKVASGVYMYFLCKVSELLDTVFFVLRKKNNQISFLHVYHHSIMIFAGWSSSKYFPGGQLTFLGFLNTFVHVIMYSYYFLAALGPQYQKYLWWKRYITTLQMVQFAFCFIHTLQLVWTDCNYPRWAIYFTLPNIISFYYLFGDFYKKAYSSTRTKKSKVITIGSENNTKKAI